MERAYRIPLGAYTGDAGQAGARPAGEEELPSGWVSDCQLSLFGSAL